jgi:2-haloacid dehalogenase
MRPPPTAVVFDLGNVLVDWDPLPAIAAAVGEDGATAFLSAEDFDFFRWNHQLDSGMTFAEAQTQVARDFPHWHPHVLAYREHFEKSLLGELDGSVAVLVDLDENGISLFALTNWPAELFSYARERFEFLQRFDDVVVSGEEGVAKPDPAVFRILQQRVSRPLDQCVFVDDRQVNVDAAAAAGMDALLFTTPARLRSDLEARALL